MWALSALVAGVGHDGRLRAAQGVDPRRARARRRRPLPRGPRGRARARRGRAREHAPRLLHDQLLRRPRLSVRGPHRGDARGGDEGRRVGVREHDPADAAAVVSAVRRQAGRGDRRGVVLDPRPRVPLVLRFEPFILAVEAESVEAGTCPRGLARATPASASAASPPACTGRRPCSARCSIRMEAPLVAKGTRLVSDEAIKVSGQNRQREVGRQRGARSGCAADRRRCSRRSARNAGAPTITKISEKRRRRTARRRRRRVDRVDRGDRGDRGGHSATRFSETVVFAVETAHAKRCKDAPKPPGGWTRRAARAATRVETGRGGFCYPSRAEAPSRRSRRSSPPRRGGPDARANGSAVSLDVSEDAESTDSEVNAGDSEADERRSGPSARPRGGGI